MAYVNPDDCPPDGAIQRDKDTYEEWGRRIDQIAEGQKGSGRTHSTEHQDYYSPGHPEDIANTLFDYDTPVRPMPAHPHVLPVGTPAAPHNSLALGLAGQGRRLKAQGTHVPDYTNGG